MKEKALLQTEKTKEQCSPKPAARTGEQKTPASPAAQSRQAAQYASGKGRPTATAMRALQRAVGNTRVQRVLGRQENDSDHAPPGLAEELAREQGGGQPLPSHVQERMERAFGEEHDFSGVRVHTDPQADALNRRLQARAFTAGEDVFFREGEFAPETASGQKLLAHELAHVVQQGQEAVGRTPSSGARVVIGAPGDAFEQAADRVAEAVASGPTPTAAQAAPGVQQQEDELIQTQAEEEEEEEEKEEEEEEVQP